MSDLHPETPVENGRVFTKLDRTDIGNNVGCLNADELDSVLSDLDSDPREHPHQELYEFLLRKKAEDVPLDEGNGYDIAELLIQKIEKNLSRNNQRSQNLAALAEEGIDAFGFEIVIDSKIGPTTITEDFPMTGTGIGLQVVWLTNYPQGTPLVYPFATQGSSGPEPIVAPNPDPRRGSSGCFFVATQRADTGSVAPDGWESVLSTVGIDAGGGGGLLSGSGAMFSENPTLLLGASDWYHFTVDLNFSLRQFGNDLLYTEECFVDTSYQHHPWLMGQLGLANPPVDDFTTDRADWTPPDHEQVWADNADVPPDETSSGQRSNDDIMFEDFVTVSGRKFTVGENGEEFRLLGGNHPDLRFKSPQRIGAWLDQWKKVRPEFNTLRVPAFGSGIPQGSDCLPLIPRVEENDVGTLELVHSDAAFERLDDLVYQCGTREIRLILMLSNYRNWQGGIRQWVKWLEDDDTKWFELLGEATNLSLTESMKDKLKSCSETHATEECDPCPEGKVPFYINETLKRWFKSHIDTVLNHTNRYTGVKYKNDPTIMMWELASEPREPRLPSEWEGDEGSGNAFGNWVNGYPEESKDGFPSDFKDWVTEMSKHVANCWSRDRKQLIAIGGGDFEDPDDHSYYTEAHNDSSNEIDAWSTHVYPGPGHWGQDSNESDTKLIERGNKTIKNHREKARTAKNGGMPMYVGEMGWRVKRLKTEEDGDENGDGDGDENGDKDAGQMDARNDALCSWFDEINRRKKNTKVSGGLVWETRMLEEYRTIREFENLASEWPPMDIYPSETETVDCLTLE